MTNHDHAPVPVGILCDVEYGMRGRHRLFAFHMAACENSAKAARLAGYSDHPGTSKATGSRLMQDPDILVLVEEEREARRQRLRVDDQRILDAYSAIAFGDTRCVVTWNERGEALISPSDALSDDEAMLVTGVTRKERAHADGGRTITIEFKFADRLQALHALARTRGLFKDKLEIETTGGIADEMEAMRQRRAERMAASEAARPVRASVVFDVSAAPTPAEVPPGRARRFLATMETT